MTTSIEAIFLVVISSLTGAFGGFLFKRASSDIIFSISKLIKNYKLIIGFFLFALSAVIYIVALTQGELNVLYPISALTYVWSSLIARRYLNEEINFYKWVGITLIIFAAILIVQ